MQNYVFIMVHMVQFVVSNIASPKKASENVKLKYNHPCWGLIAQLDVHPGIHKFDPQIHNAHFVNTTISSSRVVIRCCKFGVNNGNGNLLEADIPREKVAPLCLS